MGFDVRRERRTAGGVAQDVFVLGDEGGGSRVEVWPGAGCNCLRWRAGGAELLYAAPDWEQNPVPTRSGVPVLFPFPNRIRDGRFSWDGREYRPPVNDPAGKNAIHGFAVRKPWRPLTAGADARSAWLRCEFQGSIDAPDCRDFWPADYRLTLTHRLAANSLTIEAAVENPDAKPLPFGLGYHPYFLAGPGDQVDSTAAAFWELDAN